MPEQPDRCEYSVVVPVFENASSVDALVARLSAVFENELGAPYEIILVDDGSANPTTWTSLVDIAGSVEHVRCLRLMRNYGKPAAVICGLGQAAGRWIVTIDDDLQQRPEDIPELVRHRDHDVVVAVYLRKQHNLSVRATSAIKKWFDRRVLKLPVPMSPLKLIKAEVVTEMLRVHTPRPYIPALLAHATTDFLPVTLDHQRSQVDGSRYNTIRRLRQFSDLIVGNSSFMLRAIAALGVASVLLGFVLGIFAIASRFAGTTNESGLIVLAAVNLFLGGAALVGLGVVGEYLRRLLDLGSDKPPYAVREIYPAADDSE